eukprot:TRINITY_DN4124_c0_g2_i3.p1 TRINITY_DN4124_c0_g2~~TRINITY_DN4124_c0_g2_i3.p1  ORF type:complete len:135 (+),score=24.42 TRINITY_DN4124_c0_g2_i3:601-1005(+)
MTYCAGTLLRILVGKKELHSLLLSVEYLRMLAELVVDARFDVASDSMESFVVGFLFYLQSILTHKEDENDATAMQFIRENYAALNEILLRLIQNENYFARKESLKLLNALAREICLRDSTKLFISSPVRCMQVQ